MKIIQPKANCERRPLPSIPMQKSVYRRLTTWDKFSKLRLRQFSGEKVRNDFLHVHNVSSHMCLMPVNTNVSVFLNKMLIRNYMDYISNMDTLGQRLRWAREHKNLTQGDLADLANCSQGTIGNVESGQRHSLRNVARLAYLLDVDALWLEDGSGSPSKNQIASIANLNDVAQWITIFSSLTDAQKAQVMRLTRSLASLSNVPPLITAKNNLE